MLKDRIKDATVRIKPSKKFIELIKTRLNDETCAPKNILAIQGRTGVKEFTEQIPSPKFTDKEIEIIKDFGSRKPKDTEERVEHVVDAEEEEGPREIKGPLLEINDIKWVAQVLDGRRDKGEELPYLHQLMEHSEIILPQNEYIERNPELEARCQRLRKEQEQRQYEQMTKNVDNSQKHRPDDSIGYQIKQINKQLVAVLQFIISVAAGFAFGFIGIDLLVDRKLDFGFRLLLGIMFSLIIALAEIYFLAKKLNEDYVEPIKKSPSSTSPSKESKQVFSTKDYGKEKKEN